MLDLWLEFSSYVSHLNASTLFTIGVLIAGSSYVLKQNVDSGILTTMFVLAFQAGAFVLNFVFMKLNLTIFASPDANIIAISTIGMMIALLFMIFVMRTSSAVADVFRPTVTREGNSTLPSTIPRR